MTRPIGYYVHHQGAGHRHRAMAIAARAPERFVLLGTGLSEGAEPIRTIDLPDDRLENEPFAGQDGVQARPAALHYAPIDHDGIRRRVARITDWFAAERPALIVVDVSCEVAMLARLASVPTLYVRLHGERTDHAHVDAFHAAAALLAPYARALDDPGVAPWIVAKTMYCPGLVKRSVDATVDPAIVLVVVGRGGSSIDGAAWAMAAAATPDRQWHVIGAGVPIATMPDNLHFHGWVDDAEAWIARAGVVVGGAGDGLVGAVIAARRPYICTPEPRAFAEQHVKANRLVAVGAAIMCADPATATWPMLLAAAEALDTRVMAALDDAEGAANTAARLVALADGER